MISAYLPGDKTVQKMEVEDFALLLWEKTMADGLLYIPERDYATREREQGLRYLRCRMDWSREQALALARDVKTMAKALEKQAALERGEGENPPPAFSPADYGKPEAMEKYFNAVFFPIAGFERKLDDMVSRLIYMEKLPRVRRMEEMIRKRRSAGGPKGPEAWRGPLPAGMEAMRFWSQSEEKTQLAIQAKWLYRLFLFDAPKKMIRERTRELYRFTALDLYAREAVPVYLTRGLGFPLWEIRKPQLVREWFEEDFKEADGIDLKEWEKLYDMRTSMQTMRDLFFFRENNPPESFGEAEESMAEHMAACRELNPLGLPFYVLDEGLATGRALVICHEEEAARWEGRKSREPEEIRAAVEAFAKAFGVPEELINVYELDES